VCAAIGQGQMEVLDDRIKQRRANRTYYQAAFKNIPAITFLTEPDDTYFSNHWLTAVIIDHPKVTREDVRLHLEKDNIESRPLWKPMHLQPVFEDAPIYGNGTSEQLFEKGLCLPSGSNLTEPDLQRVVGKVRELF